MREKMEIKQLAAALVKAQSSMSGAKKDANNPFFKSKYADLPSVMSAIRPALAENGLGFVQICHDADQAAKVETIIIHESGETLSCGTISVPVSKNDAQAYGSAITYAKRYSLQAAFGVPSVDDDGNSATMAPPKLFNKAIQSQETDSAKATQEDVAHIKSLIEQSNTELDSFCTWAGISRLEELPLQMVGKAVDGLQKKIKKATAELNSKAVMDDSIAKAKAILNGAENEAN